MNIQQSWPKPPIKVKGIQSQTHTCRRIKKKRKEITTEHELVEGVFLILSVVVNTHERNKRKIKSNSIFIQKL